MITFLVLTWFLVIVALLGFYRKALLALWREPCLKRPVLIIESDDWGAGPDYQAEALQKLLASLQAFRDQDGRHPVVTLAMVLATSAGGPRQGNDYKRLTLADGRFSALNAVLAEGREKGIFALQLHGMEHYWPASLVAAAQHDQAVAKWLENSPEVGTESLPAPLQSRWIDATRLPSTGLPSDQSGPAVREEVQLFADLFGAVPNVVVPPTFVWNSDIERAWRDAGVEVLITPGTRFTARDAQGRPVSDGQQFRNGDELGTGLFCLVRDEYFEPDRGHEAQRAVQALERKSALGRPTLLETHRSNFADPALQENALQQIRRALDMALQRFGNLAFISPQQLAGYLRTRDPAWVEQDAGARLYYLVQRFYTLPRARKLAWLTGLVAPLWVIQALTYGRVSLSNTR